MADEILDTAAAAGEGGGEPAAVTTPEPAAAEGTTPEIDPTAEPGTTPAADERSEFEKLFPKDEDEPAAGTVDPNAPAPAVSVTRSHVDGLIKAGSGIFDGATDDAINAMAAQLPKMGLTAAKLMADVNAGKTGDLDRAYKAAEKAEMARVKAMARYFGER